MPDPLPPLSARELLCKTFSLYRHNFKLFAGVSILGPSAATAFRLFCFRHALAAAHPDLRSAEISMALGIAAGFAFIFPAGLMLSTAATVKAVEALSLGCEIRLAECYGALLARLWHVIAIVLIVLLRAAVAVVLCILLAAGALALAAALHYNNRVEAGAIGYACGGIALAAAAVAAMMNYARDAVAVQACVVEGANIRAALKRSRFLTEGGRIRVAVLLYGVFIMLTFAVATALAAPTLLLRAHGLAFQLFGAVAGFIALALTVPIGAISLSLLYLDERARKEATGAQATHGACNQRLDESNLSTIS
jgi:hypothetical protein